MIATNAKGLARRTARDQVNLAKISEMDCADIGLKYLPTLYAMYCSRGDVFPESTARVAIPFHQPDMVKTRFMRG